MDNENVLKELWHLNKQLPNPYTRGIWYSAKSITGKEFEILKKSAKCLYIRKWVKHLLKTPTGEIISEEMDWSYFRGNLTTGNIVQL